MNKTLHAMKRLLFTLMMTALATSLWAQNPYISLSGVVEKTDGSIELYAPQSTVAVDVTVACERTVCGPYARYAQKFLGVRAPLTDKCAWRVAAATVALAEGEQWVSEKVADPTSSLVSHTEGGAEFAPFLLDKRSSFAPTLEAAAQAAADAIYSLRKHRMELITGEAGEHVFGEGLEAALEEIARQEQAYLELFLGKQSQATYTQRYFVTPEKAKKQYVVCRFSEEKGLLPSTDLMGNMVVLQLVPEEQVTSPIPEAGPKEVATATCVVANRTACTVQYAGEEVARAELPLFQFGRTVTFALPRRK